MTSYCRLDWTPTTSFISRNGDATDTHCINQYCDPYSIPQLIPYSSFTSSGSRASAVDSFAGVTSSSDRAGSAATGVTCASLTTGLGQ